MANMLAAGGSLWPGAAAPASGCPGGRLRAGNGLVCIPAGASDSINIFCLIQKLRGGTNSGTGFCAQRPELGARTVKCHLGRL